MIVIAIASSGGDDGATKPAADATPSVTTDAAPADETTAPAETEEPAEPEQPSWAAADFSGTGDGVVAITKPAETPALLTMTHQGTANFAVFTLTADNTQADLLANTIGSFSGTVLFDENEMLGNSTTQLQVTADGPWTLRLAPLSDARSTGANFSATGPGVFIYDGGSGTAAFNHEGQSNFSVISIDPDGDLHRPRRWALRRDAESAGERNRGPQRQCAFDRGAPDRRGWRGRPVVHDRQLSYPSACNALLQTQSTLTAWAQP